MYLQLLCVDIHWHINLRLSRDTSQTPTENRAFLDGTMQFAAQKPVKTPVVKLVWL